MHLSDTELQSLTIRGKVRTGKHGPGPDQEKTLHIYCCVYGCDPVYIVLLPPHGWSPDFLQTAILGLQMIHRRDGSASLAGCMPKHVSPFKIRHPACLGKVQLRCILRSIFASATGTRSAWTLW
jgi:hypothetical protein